MRGSGQLDGALRSIRAIRAFLGFLVSWFLGFLVSRFLGFLVSSFLRFFDSSFLRFKVSKFQSSKDSHFQVFSRSIFLEDTEHILPNVQFLRSGRKMLMPY